MIESAQRARALDGIPPMSGPLRIRPNRSQANPYFQEWFISSLEEPEEEEWQERRERLRALGSIPKKDYWELDLKEKKLKSTTSPKEEPSSALKE